MRKTTKLQNQIDSLRKQLENQRDEIRALKFDNCTFTERIGVLNNMVSSPFMFEVGKKIGKNKVIVGRKYKGKEYFTLPGNYYEIWDEKLKEKIVFHENKVKTLC